ncbi:uncharacterized protein IUM83_06449 [Phytophthora cinnamomi]|uniref:uncharacterized protein n=1 Tax=Phytophthora cinnamomi TaxID=4785 RepID=UPI0035597731|nr:hypothetical protein IUM83_06449 [Phytophthora cinnamomi]
MEDLSSTESESYDDNDTELSTTVPAAPIHAPSLEQSASCNNILDLQIALATEPPAPLNRPEPDVFVIPRRPVASAAASSPAPPPEQAEFRGRAEMDPSVCGHSLRVPQIVHSQDPVARHSCTCCKRNLDSANFSKTQRQERKAATRKCRDCIQNPATGKRKQKRVRHRSKRGQIGPEEPRLWEWSDQESEQVALDQRTKMTWQERWEQKKRLIEQGHPPSRTTYPPRAAAVRAQAEWRHPPQPKTSALAQHHGERQRSQYTTPQPTRKQLIGQKRLQEMAGIDSNLPPPRTSRPRRAAAIRAQEEWRLRPQPSGSALVTSRFQQGERDYLLNRARGASSRSGNPQHPTMSRFGGHR